MHSLVMSPCSRDLIVMSLVAKLIGAWFLDSERSTCFSNIFSFSSKMPLLVRKGALHNKFAYYADMMFLPSFYAHDIHNWFKPSHVKCNSVCTINCY